jgi:hypothetical protein
MQSRPVFVLSPFEFLNRVAANPEKYRDDYRYKVDLYLASGDWQVKNIGVKLIGLFKLTDKAGILMNLAAPGQANGFIRRNAVNALAEVGYWNPEVKDLADKLLKDPYYEVRVACLTLLRRVMPREDFPRFRYAIRRILKGGLAEEKCAALALLGKKGNAGELEFGEKFLLSNNSIIRETFVTALLDLYRRNEVNREEIQDYLQRILITSNHLEPRFRIKTLINRIYREIE